MNDETQKPPTRIVEVAVGPNPDGERDQARLAHGHVPPASTSSDVEKEETPLLPSVKEN